MPRRISMQGEVKSPRPYLVDGTFSLADVLAVAGRLMPNADPNKIRLVREGELLEVSLCPETTDDRSPIRSGDQISC